MVYFYELLRQKHNIICLWVGKSPKNKLQLITDEIKKVRLTKSDLFLSTQIPLEYNSKATIYKKKLWFGFG